VHGDRRTDHVRVPRETLLMRNVEVTPEGQYVRRPGSADKASYGTMVFVRAYIVAGAASALAKGLTIAVRYSAGACALATTLRARTWD
jgi:acyl-CoA oxidase